MIDFIYGLQPNDVITYDIETYPNVFTAGFKIRGQRFHFERSPYYDNINEFMYFIRLCNQLDVQWVGFNNIHFDYPVIHHLYKSNGLALVSDIYDKAMTIIKADWNARFAHTIYESDWVVKQIDLLKINHFDNKARATSLKVLEFNMRMMSVEDLPFDVGLNLTRDQRDVLVQYMGHDIDATEEFLNHCKDAIEFRKQLSAQYDIDMTNFNDTKIGKELFINRLEQDTPGSCFDYSTGRKVKRQTIRDQINLGDVILPYVKFEHPEFIRIHEWFQSKVITETKGAITEINCDVNGFQFDFGTGGIHGSIESQIIESDDEYIIEDWDVASYYPNLAIVNNLHPEHLGDAFCRVYKDLYVERSSHKKGTPQNAALKLALNGVYGDSNSEYSPFYDPQFTMAITVNGQLSLCMLAEQLMKLDTLTMIQINTDGLTIKYPRVYKEWVHSVTAWWEQLTKLQLEVVEYSRFFVRDVNNYIAEYTDGSVKRKGAYEYKLGWHQNHSNIVSIKAAEAALLHGKDIREFITNHNDFFDFMLRTKIPRSAVLEWGDEIVQNTSRYYISTDGDYLRKVDYPKAPLAGLKYNEFKGSYKRKQKISDDYFCEVICELTGKHPLIDDLDWSAIPHDERIHTKNKSVYMKVRSEFNAGHTVMIANKIDQQWLDYADAMGLESTDINFEFYINEAIKLVNAIRG